MIGSFREPERTGTPEPDDSFRLLGEWAAPGFRVCRIWRVSVRLSRVKAGPFTDLSIGLLYKVHRP